MSKARQQRLNHLNPSVTTGFITFPAISEEEVRKEIEKSIHEAYLQKSPAFVNTFGDREPTVEEFLEQTAMQCKC